ncbi:MAG: c-type cytochrome [Anaerolineales bacterium]
MGRERIHLAIGTIATGILAAALGLYIWQEPLRMETARLDLLNHQIVEGQVAYAQNCALCHGAAGEGLGANPSLDNPGIREGDYGTLYKVVARGLFETAMPAWSVTEGGPLNDAQLEAILTMVQFGEWEETWTTVFNLGLMPREPIAVEVSEETLVSIRLLPDGEKLANAATTYGAYCIACHGENGLGTELAPALNNADLRAEADIEMLTRSITQGVPSTLMAGWDGVLTTNEVDDLITLILKWDTLPVDAIPAPPEQPIVITEQLLEAGSALFTQNCAWCHGSEGQGTRRGPAINVQSFFEKVTNDAAAVQIVTMGIPDTSMPSWGDRLSPSEIEAIVAFIRQWEPTAPPVAVPETGRPRGGGSGPPWMRNK